MYWVLTVGDAGVPIADSVATRVLSAIDVNGAFPLDQYAEDVIGSERIPQLATVLGGAIRQCLAAHRADVQKRLQLTSWQEWAEPLFEKECREDAFLTTLNALLSLADEAVRLRAGIRHQVA